MEIAGPPTGYFNPDLDPRCRIVPQPELNLYGDTARFRPTAVCQSRGLYTDSVLFRNAAAISSHACSWLPWLSWQLSFNETSPSPRPAGVHESGSTFGSRNRPPHWLLPAAELDASALFRQRPGVRIPSGVPKKKQEGTLLTLVRCTRRGSMGEAAGRGFAAMRQENARHGDK